MRLLFLFLNIVCLQSYLLAQEHLDKVMSQNAHGGDSVKSIKGLLDQSAWHFHSRSFFMNTLNQGTLKDDYALAQGAGIGLVTKPLKGFQMGLSGYFIFNVWSSNLAEKDPQTQALNRYEIGQFDVLDRGNKSSLDRLEELFLKYSWNRGNMTLGRFSVETPFVNMQDGRMRPTLEEGLWLQSETNKNWKLQGGVFWRIFPRSTANWMELNESIGIYGSGLNAVTGKSDLKIDDDAKKLYLLNAEWRLSANSQVKFWNVMFDQVMNTQLLEFRQKHPFRGGEGFINVMWIQQNTIGDGGNNNSALTYFQKGAQSNVLSAQIAWKVTKKVSNTNINLNYTHILDGDRYLMPREWGKDPFYTFMPRERNEGMANVHAFTTQFSKLAIQGIKLGAGLGYYRLPSITNYAQNKYGMPSYGQVNLFASYVFKGVWEGLEIRFLVAGKTDLSQEEVPLKNQINKVNMINSNVVIDFHL